MGSDVGQIFPTASLHTDHSISYALVCEKSRSCGWDKEIPLGVLPMEQLDLKDKWARIMCLAQGHKTGPRQLPLFPDTGIVHMST